MEKRFGRVSDEESGNSGFTCKGKIWHKSKNIMVFVFTRWIVKLQMVGRRQEPINIDTSAECFEDDSHCELRPSLRPLGGHQTKCKHLATMHKATNHMELHLAILGQVCTTIRYAWRATLLLVHAIDNVRQDLCRVGQRKCNGLCVILS